MRKISPTLFKVALISFFADVAGEFLYPITPIFLSTVLGASALSIGLIEGSADAIASLLKTYSGKWSDQSGKRKPFIWIGYLIAALAKPITGFAQAWPLVLFARTLDRTGKGLRSAPRDALIADITDPKDLGFAFGFHRALDTLGAVVGPLLAILCLYFLKDQMRPLFYVAFIPGLIAVWISLTLPESKNIVKSATKKISIKLSSLPRNYFCFILIWGIFSLSNSSDAFIILRASQSGMGTTHTILLYTFFNLVYAGASFPLGGLSDKIGRKVILISGLFLFSFSYFGFSRATQVYEFWIYYGLYGLFMAMTEGIGKAFVVDLVPPEKKATALGLFGTVTGISTLMASLSAGFLWDQVSPESAFIFGAAGALLAGILMLFFNPKK